LSPILGIWASQISGRLWEPAGAYDALATVTVPSGGAASVTFAGIPTGYKHLQIRGIARTATGNANNAYITLNGDTGANYSWHQLFGSGSGNAGASGSANQSATGVSMFNFSDSTFAANIFGIGIMDILDYANTNKFKTVRLLTGTDSNGGGFIIMRSAGWRNTAAITSISITPDSGTFAQHTQFALYGVK
jgi:hypothetical protein